MIGFYPYRVQMAHETEGRSAVHIPETIHFRVLVHPLFPASVQMCLW